MKDSDSTISAVALGERLKLARENSRLTQSEAAAALKIARTTLVSIEQGVRRAKIDEVQKLSRLYGTSANALLRGDAVHVDLVPRFRKLGAANDAAIEHAATLLNHLVSAEAELSRILGVHVARSYPPERPILGGDVEAQAEHDAQELRNWLGLGASPVLDIVSLLEDQVGLRVFLRPIDSKISGLFAFDDKLGGFVLLNSKHPIERITQTGAHELAHFVSTRRKTDVTTLEPMPLSREERYANCFQRAFLTPARIVKMRFQALTAGQSHLTRRHVVLLAESFGVSREAIVRRLEELKLAKHGTWEWFVRHGGITNEQVAKVLGTADRRQVSGAESYGQLPARTALLAMEAWKKELLSESQLADLLQLNLLDLRGILDEDFDNEDADFVRLSS